MADDDQHYQDAMIAYSSGDLATAKTEFQKSYESGNDSARNPLDQVNRELEIGSTAEPAPFRAPEGSYDVVEGYGQQVMNAAKRNVGNIWEGVKEIPEATSKLAGEYLEQGNLSPETQLGIASGVGKGLVQTAKDIGGVPYSVGQMMGGKNPEETYVGKRLTEAPIDFAANLLPVAGGLAAKGAETGLAEIAPGVIEKATGVPTDAISTLKRFPAAVTDPGLAGTLTGHLDDLIEAGKGFIGKLAEKVGKRSEVDANTVRNSITTLERSIDPKAAADLTNVLDRYGEIDNPELLNVPQETMQFQAQRQLKAAGLGGSIMGALNNPATGAKLLSAAEGLVGAAGGVDKWLQGLYLAHDLLKQNDPNYRKQVPDSNGSELAAVDKTI
jgi:hypothetical protein